MNFVEGPTSSTKRLRGKVAIITGGASGIGASTVRLFHENGANVVIADIQGNLGRSICDNLGAGVDYIHCDVSKEEDVRDLVDSTVSKYGKLDIMYNNAGITDGLRGTIVESAKEDLESVLKVNLYGAFYGGKHAARVMMPRKEGCILFTSSACTLIAGIATHPYMMSKYGILGFTKNLSAELKQHGIRVNCISPSGVFTSMAPELEGARRVLTTDDVALAALYLASDEGKYVSGHNLPLDGGRSVVNPSMTWAFKSNQ